MLVSILLVPIDSFPHRPRAICGGILIVVSTATSRFGLHRSTSLLKEDPSRQPLTVLTPLRLTVPLIVDRINLLSIVVPNRGILTCRRKIGPGIPFP